MISKGALWVQKKKDLLIKTIGNCAQILALKKGQVSLADMREFKAMFGKSELILKACSTGVRATSIKKALDPQDLDENEEG